MSRMKELVMEDIYSKCAQLAERFGYTKEFMEGLYFVYADAGYGGWDEILQEIEETFEALPEVMHGFLRGIQSQVDFSTLVPVF